MSNQTLHITFLIKSFLKTGNYLLSKKLLTYIKEHNHEYEKEQKKYIMITEISIKKIEKIINGKLLERPIFKKL